MTKKSLMMIFMLVLAGCEGGEACDNEGVSRCYDNAVETCAGGAWEVEEACSSLCFQQPDMNDGAATCM